MKNRRVVIVGFMGCGKTTVAKALAQRLDCELIDLDTFITEREGRSPAKIIEQDGEPAFRDVETRELRAVLRMDQTRVIALGGGAWIVEANRSLIAQHSCLSVWLDAPFELCWQRITSSGKTLRPLAPDRETALRLFHSRVASYSLADVRLEVTQRTAAAEIAKRIRAGY